MVIGFVAAVPRPARSRAYASPAALPRPSQGSLPVGADSPFAGRDSHPLDDIPNFMNSSHDSLLSDQNFLVALKRLGSGDITLADGSSGEITIEVAENPAEAALVGGHI